MNDAAVFSRERKLTLAALGERQLIERIRSWLGPVTPPSPYGIGDDCAVLPTAKTPQVITVDPVIYRRHFDDTVRARDVGAKLLKRNLSDVAAMGAMPSAAVISLAVDSHLRTRWLRSFYLGLADTAKAFDVPIVGGDVAEAPGCIIATLTLLGRATAPRLLTRDGATEGSHIFVTGQLGGSILGHHYRFTPRLAEGSWLAARSEVQCMMDVSDGLAKDVYSLTPPGCRPALLASAIPTSRAAVRVSQKSKRPVLDHALSDGEDYELVFALAPEASPEAFIRTWKKRFSTPLTCIGRFVPTSIPSRPEEVRLSAFQAYEHLR